MNEDIAVKALATAETVREVTTSVMVVNAIVIVTDLVKTIRAEVKDETLCTHHVFRTAVGSTKYVGKDAVQPSLKIRHWLLVQSPIDARMAAKGPL